MSKLPTAVSVLTLGLAACGSSSKTPPTADAPDQPIDGPGSAAVDAPSCTPVVPSAVAIHGGGSDLTQYTGDVTLTSSGEVAVWFYDGANGINARTWENGTWTTHNVFTGTNGSFGTRAAAEIAGRPVYLANVSGLGTDSDKIRDWLQLSTGDFAIGERVGAQATVSDAAFAHYSSASGVLSVAGSDLNHSLYNFERSSAGTWTTGYVALLNTGTIRAAGLGTFSDGTAAEAGTGSGGLVLYRRNGQTWSPQKTIVAGNITTGFVAFPPTGTTGVAIWLDPNTQLPRGATFSTTDGTPGAAVDLKNAAIGSYFFAEVAFDPSGTSGKILLTDDQSPSHSYVVGFQGTSFTAAQDLRPDVVFDAPPHIVYHPCGGYMILHVTRAVSDAIGSEDAVFEPLATFWPGH